MAAPKPALDRFARIDDLATTVRQLLSKALVPLSLAIVVTIAVLGLTDNPGTKAFTLISLGSLLVLFVWRSNGVGLPIIPVLGLQTLVAYGLPILNGNETVMVFSENALTRAGLEVLVFCGSITAFWIFGLNGFSFGSARCYALQGFADEKMGRLSKLGFQLVVFAVSFEILTRLELLNFVLGMLPSGSNSIITALLSAVSACGFFLSSMLVGKGGLGTSQRLLFWALLGVHCFIGASAFLLSSTITVVFSVLIGLFWGGGRVPWRFIVVILGIISFFNVGKFTMRDRYWRMEDGGEGIPQFTLQAMPATYAEWTVASLESLTNEDPAITRQTVNDPAKKKGQTLAERINNLQNLLYVMEVMDRDHLEPLSGATYWLIPPLLVPRIMWPDKPRSHDGQVLLNVHFGRQDMHSTLKTYIAWGLLPEAYGNFGSIAGAIFIGACLGLAFAWVEKSSAPKLLLSIEGFLCFTLFIAMANSFEMVASVLITSVFQAFIPIILAAKPFTEQVTPRRPDAPASA